MNRNKVIYSICVDDLRQVATQELGRDLTEIEVAEISDKIGDYVDWYQAIENAIADCCATTSD